MAKKNTQLEAIAREIEQYSRDIAKNLATKTRDMLYEEANKAMKMFYGHYDPDVYKRHLPIGSNIKRSYRKYYANPHGNIISGGIEISSEWMNDIYRIRPDYIFNLIYLGYHGNVAMFPDHYNIQRIPPIMSPNPLEIILDKKDYIQKNITRYANSAANKVKKTGNYKYIT